MRSIHLRRVGAVLAVVVLLTVLLVPVASASSLERSSGWGAPPRGRHYIVRWGDTLSGIAWRHGVSMHALMRANHIINPHRIYAGQWLHIPGPGVGPWGPQYYRVRYGDTLSGIAVRFGTTVHRLMRLNNIWHPDWIYAGRLLKIRP